MAYTPIAQRGTTTTPVVPKTGYVPVAQRQPVEPREPVDPSLLDFSGIQSGGMAQSTPMFKEHQPFANTGPGIALNTAIGIPKAITEVAGGMARGIAREGFSVGMGLANVINKARGADITTSYQPPETGVSLARGILGTEPISDLSTQYIKAEKAIQESDYFNALGGEVTIGGQKFSPLVLAGFAGMTALDLTPFGGGELNAAKIAEKNIPYKLLKLIAETSDPEELTMIAKRIRVHPDVIPSFVKAAQPIESTKEALNFMKTFDFLPKGVPKQAALTSADFRGQVKDNVYQALKEFSTKPMVVNGKIDYGNVPDMIAIDDLKAKVKVHENLTDQEVSDAVKLLRKYGSETVPGVEGTTIGKLPKVTVMGKIVVAPQPRDTVGRFDVKPQTSITTKANIPAPISKTSSRIIEDSIAQKTNSDLGFVQDGGMAGAKGISAQTVDRLVKGKDGIWAEFKSILQKAKDTWKSLPNKQGGFAKLPSIGKKAAIQEEKNIPAILYDDLSSIAEKMRRTDLTGQEIEQIKTEIEITKDAIDQLPGKQLMKYVSKTTGKLPEVTGQTRMKSLTGSGATVKGSKFRKEGDQLISEMGFNDLDEAQKGLEEYRTTRTRLEELKDRARELRVERSAVRKGERLMQLAKGDRRSAYRNMADYFNLTDAELAKIRHGKDIMAMEPKEFESFLRKAEDKAEEIIKVREARIQLEGTIQNKELKNWENVKDAMKFPAISDMNEAQLKQLDDVLSQYKTGDEFLTVRQLETIDRTELSGLKTTREVQDHLAKMYNLKPEQLPGIKPHPWMYDTQLARQHPLYKLLTTKYNESYLKAASHSIEVERKADDLITKARKSTDRSLGERAVPTDEKVTQWLEAEDRAAAANGMTPEQLDAAEYMDSVYKDYYDWLSKREVEKKFTSRFEDKYFPHVRRGFLEAFKEDGFLKAVKEAKDQFLNDEKMLTILDQKTGSILPYQKWVKFSQFRSGGLVPTKNASMAFKAYVTSLEKAKQFDEFIPEIMIYVHSLTPRNLTGRGVEMDDSIKRFVQSWINAKKGRVEKQILKPGGKMDWALRTGVAITRIRDLGLSPVGLTSFFGEQAGNLTMLGAKDYAKGMGRLVTSKGREITSKYAEFVGKPLFETLTEASNNIGDTLMGGIFGLFSASSRKANQIFLLGSMTKEEFASGVISTSRLAELRNEMGAYRGVSGAESIFGKSVEGAVAGQYKKWAIPILVSTKDNATKFLSLLAKKGVKEALSSKEGSQLFYSVVLGSALGLGIMGYYNELSTKKRNFVEDLIFKSSRDALSLIGALDPKFIGSFAAPRLSAFIVDLTTAIDDLLFLQTYKTTGNLKGISELKTLATPSIIRTVSNLVPGEATAPKKTTKTVKTPAGLPKLPSTKLKLPTPKGLPKLPKL